MRQIQMMPRRFDVSWRKPDANLVLNLSGQDQDISSPLKDRSGYGNDGTITGATWKKLPSGLWYLNFDGTNDEVDLGTSSSLGFSTIDFSILGWYQSDSAVRQCLFNKSTDNNGSPPKIWLTKEASGVLEFYHDDGVNASDRVTTFDEWDDGAWHHFAILVDRDTNVVLMRNGVVDATWVNTNAQLTISNNGNFYLGHRDGSLDLNGDLALFKMHNALLTVSTVANIFAQERHLLGV